MNGRAGSEPKLLFPGLAGFYATVSDLWYPMIASSCRRRVCSRARMDQGERDGPAALHGFMAKLGFGLRAVLLLAYSVIFLETVVAFCVILGLCTRFFAAGFW